MAPEVKQRKCPVLSDTSLELLASVLDDGLKFGMMLALPNTRIVRMKIEADEKGLDSKNLAMRVILNWKSEKRDKKNSEKVAELERTLREMNRHEYADALKDRQASGQELTPDAFVI